jgi:general secretion pathway protein N
MTMDVQLRWQHAGLRTLDGNVELGNLFGTARAQAGMIQLQLHDDGQGPLQMDGQLQLSPLGWRLDATVCARHTDPVLDAWLSRLGPADADGNIHIQRHGGLAANAGSPSQSEDTKQHEP